MTPQTRRRKFLKKARDEAYQKGRNSIKCLVGPWLAELKHFATQKNWKKVQSIIARGIPGYPTIECAADISQLFTIAQHDLDRHFSEIDGSVFASEVVRRGKEKLQK